MRWLRGRQEYAAKALSAGTYKTLYFYQKKESKCGSDQIYSEVLNQSPQDEAVDE